MSAVDRMWLRMDDPTNLMMITGVLCFDEPLERSRIERILRERLLPIPRFRHRVVPLGGRPGHEWRAEASPDLDWHLQEVTLPSPGDDGVLREFVSDWMSRPLEPSRPLWQVHLIQNHGQGAAMLWRLHHCIGDGIALMLVLLSLTDLAAPAGVEDLREATRSSPNPLRRLFDSEAVSPEGARRLLERVLPQAVRLLSLPAETVGELGPWRKGGASVPAFGRLAFRPPDARTIFKGPLGSAKRVAWSSAIPLAEVEAVRLGLGGTVNDVLTNAVAGGLRRYLEGRGALRSRLNLRAVVPVSLRPLEQMHQLGNQFGLVFLSLPVGIADPRARLAEVRRRMGKIKRSLEPVVALKIMAALGASPRRVQDLVVRIFGAKGTAVLTNVPGPVEPLSFAGKPIRSFMFWVPQAARLGMGISILSYAGNVTVGVATDAGLVPDPESIVTGLEQEFQVMRRLASGSGAASTTDG